MEASSYRGLVGVLKGFDRLFFGVAGSSASSLLLLLPSPFPRSSSLLSDLREISPFLCFESEAFGPEVELFFALTGFSALAS